VPGVVGLDRKMILRRARFAAWVVAIGVVAWGFWIDHQQDLDRCHARNDSIRVAVFIGAETLIEQFPNISEERSEKYLSDLAVRLEAAEVDCT
jgi:hypothetical protein